MVPRFNHIFIFVFLYKSVTLKKCRPKHVGENFVNKIRHKYWSAFVAYFYILDNNKHLIAVKGG